jgi:predicted nucleic acid-binding protein
MAAVVLDASILIGLFNPGDPFHATADRAVRAAAEAADQLVISAVTYSEVLVGFYAAGIDPRHDQALQAFLTMVTIAPLDPPVAERAAALRAAHGIRLPDALVLATGIVLGAGQILTGDRRWAAIDTTVRVLTP